MKLLIIGIFISLMPVWSYAQSGNDTLRIYLKDSVSGKPIPGVNVTIKDAAASGQSIHSDVDGSLVAPLPTDYKLPITLLIRDGTYKPFTRTLNVLPADTVLILLVMKDPYRLLDEVTVDNPSVTQDARGATLDITKLKDADKMTLAKALELIPGLEIDPQSNSITYLGRALAIQKDGISVAGFSNLIKNRLQLSRADRYKKISINLYDLKTEQAVISFEEPQYEDGIMNDASANIGTNRSSINSNTSIYYKKQIFTISPEVNANYSPTYKSKKDLTYLNTPMKIKSESVTPSNFNKGGRVSLGYNVDLSSKNTVDISFLYNASEQKNKNEVVQQQFLEDDLESELITRNKSNQPLFSNGLTVANVAFVHKFKPGKRSKRLDIATNYLGVGQENNKITRSETTIGEAISGSNTDLHSRYFRNSLQNHISYEYQHEKLGGFEVVAKYFYRTMDNRSDTRFYHLVPPDSTWRQSSDTRYHYGALLASWDKAFKPLSVRVVLKQDYSSERVSTTSGEHPHVSYSTFAPYISLQKYLKKGRSLRLESRYQTYRPTLEKLTELSDPTQRFTPSGYVFRANPDLKSQTNFDIDVNYMSTIFKQHSFFLISSYKHTYHPIQQYRFLEDDVSVITTRNLYGSDMLKFYSTVNLNLFTRFSLGLSPSYTLRHYDVGDGDMSYTHSYSVGVKVEYGFTPTLRATINSSFDKISLFQMPDPWRVNSMFFLTYTKSKFSANFMVFNWHKWKSKLRSVYKTDSFIDRMVSDNLRTTISLGLSYHFDHKFKRKGRTSGKQVIKDDM